MNWTPDEIRKQGSFLAREFASIGPLDVQLFAHDVAKSFARLSVWLEQACYMLSFAEIGPPYTNTDLAFFLKEVEEIGGLKVGIAKAESKVVSQ